MSDAMNCLRKDSKMEHFLMLFRLYIVFECNLFMQSNIVEV